MSDYGTRSLLREEFIRKFSSAGPRYDVYAMEGDAGLRQYYRINNGCREFVLMDCPPKYQALEPFIYMSNFLRQHGFVAPEILSADIENGFLIIEDFGQYSIKNKLDVNSQDHVFKDEIYTHLIDILIELHRKPLPAKSLRVFDNELLLQELEVFQWYMDYISGSPSVQNQNYTDFLELWPNIANKQAPMQQVLVLRDYHVENTMYLGQKLNGRHAIGLLDFQDALIGSPVYDLVSLLEDARYEVNTDYARKFIEYFCQKSGLNLEDVLLNYHILGLQRNMRILGVFARKFLRDKNDNYLKYIPRVLEYLKHDLSHPDLEQARVFADQFLFQPR